MSDLGDIYRAFSQRAVDIRPAGPELHAAMLRWQSKEHVPPERNLGPSLTQSSHRDHIFRVYPHAVEFGTRVPYSLAHQAWRFRNGRESHLRFKAPILQEIAEIVGRYIMRGQQ